MNDQNQSHKQTKNVPTKEPWYKKWWVITIGALLLLSIIGSSGEDDESKDDQNQPTQEKSKSISQEKIKKQEIKNDNDRKEENISEKLIINLCITDSENADVWKQMGVNLWKDFDDPSKGSENIPACESIEVEVLEKRNVDDIEKYKVKYGQIEGWTTKRLLIGDEAKNKKEVLSKNIIINIHEILNKSFNEIEKVLGKADEIKKVSPSGTSCTNNPCDKGLFQSGKYEIVFIDNKSSWITIIPNDSYSLNEESIELIGLPKTKPSLNNKSSLIKWENIDDIKEVSFFDNGSEEIDYIYLKLE